MQGALKVVEEGIAQHPDHAQLRNSAGDFAMRSGDPAKAETHFRHAAEFLPDHIDFAINLAIALGAQECHAEAIAVLEKHRANGEHEPRYCSARANSARALHDLDEAQRWYDRSLALSPNQARALHGRARVAIERGDTDAVPRFEAAVAANSRDPHAWLGLAEALNAAGDTARSRELAEKFVDQAPQWVDALRLLAQLRLAAGDEDFAGHFAEAARKRPDDTSIPRAHITVLEGHDRFAEALEVARKAQQCFPGNPHFPLMVATLAGYLADTQLANNVYRSLDDESQNRCLMEARFRLQVGQFERAEHLLDKLQENHPWDITGWATRDLLWRLQGDDRANWLHGQEGLVQLVELPDAARVLGKAIPLLHRLHDQSAFPIGQSLRGGTQTRGVLFNRHEEELSVLCRALKQALEKYRSGLPAADPTHPLLRHSETAWDITSSWSVRLRGGGDHHTPHLHPEGIVSSALYCELPEEFGTAQGEDSAGWIELGRPPPKMHIDLEPIYALEPATGYLALFPSTLYHGTRPFPAGHRMTVAFDITPTGNSA